MGIASRTKATQFSCDVFCLNPKIRRELREAPLWTTGYRGAPPETEIFVLKKRSRMPLRSFYLTTGTGHRLPCCAGFSLADQGSHSDPRGDFAPYRALFSVSCAHPKKVKLGRDFGTTTEILDGLNDNDLLVLNPSTDLAEGAEVVPQLASEDKQRRDRRS
jgi:hypothetical protein